MLYLKTISKKTKKIELFESFTSNLEYCNKELGSALVRKKDDEFTLTYLSDSYKGAWF